MTLDDQIKEILHLVDISAEIKNGDKYAHDLEGYREISQEYTHKIGAYMARYGELPFYNHWKQRGKK